MLDESSTPMKTCSRCGVAKPATTECFVRNRAISSGLASMCRACNTELKRARRRACGVPEMQSREVGVSNRLRCCTCGATKPATLEFFRTRGARGSRPYLAYRSECRECDRARCADFRSDNPDYFADYRTAHHDERRVYNADYHVAHSEQINARIREWGRNNPDMLRASSHRRRASKRGAPGTHGSADIVAQRKRQHGRCYWCGEKIRGTDHVDHVMPLALGGSDGPENLVIACPSCNFSKGAKHPMEWAGCLL